MERMIVDGKELAKYDDWYYVSRDGDVYSLYSNKFLKHSLTKFGHHRVDIHQKHMSVHRLVWIAWTGCQPKYQINHKDDNKDNNSLDNLYDGTQKENVADCFRNKHRLGNVWSLTIRNKTNGEVLNFTPAYKFMEYSGHTAVNGGLKKVFTRDWFKEKYEIIDYSRCKGVTTIPYGSRVDLITTRSASQFSLN